MKEVNIRIKKTFFKKLRHNLRNPINAVLGFSELLTEEFQKNGIHKGMSHLVSIQETGHDIIKKIDKELQEQVSLLQLNNERLETTNIGEINKIGSEIKSIIDGQLRTMSGHIEALMKQNQKKVKIYVDDISIMHESCQFLENELNTLTSFQFNDLSSLDLELQGTALLTEIQDVLDSIQPLTQGEHKELINGTILIVDDNQSNISLLRKRFEKIGHKVLSAPNGYDALMLITAEGKEIDLILLDIIMPDINGYEVLKFIKSDNRYFHIPVVMLSSLDEVDSMFRCFELGADDYITKPFEPTLLNARLNSYVEKKKLKDKEQIYLNTIREEKDKSERLLLNILPAEIAERLKSGETTIADKLNNVTILFADLVNFTRLSKKLSPSELVELLNTIFRKFDDLCDAYSMEKIKTIGDSYLAASGIPKPIKTHAENAMKMATDILKYIEEIKAYGSELNIRIGMHSGSIVAGVIGKKKFVYDLWGDTVNIASRMESQGSAGKIHVTETVMKKLKDQYNFESCGKKEFKGVGKINTYYLLEDKK